MAKRRNYITAPQFWKDMYTHQECQGKWTPVDRVPIERIRIDKSLFSYQNEVDSSQVLRMIVNFDQELWMPITVNEDYSLLDGQHRLRVADALALKYIDVIVERDDVATETQAEGLSQ